MNHRILTTLEKHAVRPTPMRMLVLEHFLQQRSAQSLAELEAAMPRADRITLYRTLKSFAEKGILHEVEDGTGATRYALCQDACAEGRHRDFHPHFHCTSCGQTVCLDAVHLSAPALPAGYQAAEVEMTVRGVCPGCAGG
ncbi:MAG: transcriptional repressor [Phaeodactylibacter sp.]|nr:transcriptional repressor [Phaeodactylibacter sp.]MCB9292724.1 transcriptional repressor [Lewinellaceae bacterium]